MQVRNPEGSPPGAELRQALNELRPFFVRSAWFTLIAGLLVLAPSGYMLEVYERVINSRSHMTLWMLTLGVLFAYAVMETLEWAHNEEMHKAGLQFDARLSSRVFLASFEANLRRLPGGTTQPLNDLRMLRDFLISPVLKAVMESPVSLLLLLIIFAMSPLLGWASVVGAVIQVTIAWLNERGTQAPLTEANRSATAAQNYADGSLRNAQVIEAMGMLKDIHGRWIKRQRKFLDLQALASGRAALYTTLAKTVQIVWGSLLLGLGAWLMLKGQLDGAGGQMIVASILGGQVLKPLVQMVTGWGSVVKARDSWSRLSAMLATLPLKPEAMALPAPRGQLVAENLIVAAPNSQATILRGVSFAVNPGEVLAVIGPSAAGKTSLARALMGLWPSLGGKARLDGADLHAWDKSELGPHVGYLPQDVELFDGSIAENIARFGEVLPRQVEAAARAVGLHELIMALPEGYDTDVGPEGMRLSGGQRQRVGLARALYGDPVFVLLDEPNSSLDEAGDAALASAISQGKARGTTFVVITHRTSVLSVADKILLLRDGTLQAFGPRDDVLAALQKASQPATPAARPQPPALGAQPALEATK
jgi:ATP-binding cassette subfamily C exporter for protease/lipase